MLTLILAAAVVSGQDAEKKAEPTPKGTLMPVPGYVPKPGDRVMLYNRIQGRLSDVYGATEEFWFNDLRKSVYAGDAGGLRKMVEEGQAIKAPSGTQVLVIACHSESQGARVPGSNARFAPETSRCTVRILSGDQKDESMEVQPEFVKDCRVVRGR